MSKELNIEKKTTRERVVKSEKCEHSAGNWGTKSGGVKGGAKGRNEP